MCQVLACRSQMSSNNMSSNEHNRYHYHITQYRKTIPVQEIGMKIKKWYRYRGLERIQKNVKFLKNSIRKYFKLAS